MLLLLGVSQELGLATGSLSHVSSHVSQCVSNMQTGEDLIIYLD